jgi:DNA-binding transcriptional regulator YdaS (Cro superfamily)
MNEFAEWVRAHTQVKAAARFGVTQKAISKWVNGELPLKRVRQVEQITGIPAWKLRPDTFKRAS